MATSQNFFLGHSVKLARPSLTCVSHVTATIMPSIHLWARINACSSQFCKDRAFEWHASTGSPLLLTWGWGALTASLFFSCFENFASSWFLMSQSRQQVICNAMSSSRCSLYRPQRPEELFHWAWTRQRNMNVLLTGSSSDTTLPYAEPHLAFD